MSYSLALLKWVCGFNWLQCDCLCKWEKLWLWGSISQSSRQNNHSGVNRPLVFSRLPTFNLIQCCKKNTKGKRLPVYFFHRVAWPQCRTEMWAQPCPTCNGVLQSHCHTTALMGSLFTWGHRAAQSTNVQHLLGVPSAGSVGKGLSQALTKSEAQPISI